MQNKGDSLSDSHYAIFENISCNNGISSNNNCHCWVCKRLGFPGDVQMRKVNVKCIKKIYYWRSITRIKRISKQF